MHGYNATLVQARIRGRQQRYEMEQQQHAALTLQTYVRGRYQQTLAYQESCAAASAMQVMRASQM